MARRKKGRPINGWLVIDKPSGISSTSVVAKVRWALRAQKAGHAGTLDPLATGVVAVALGEATKTVPYAMDALKAYRFTIKWGEARDSDDTEGEIVSTSDKRPSRVEIEAQLSQFEGEIMQRPPSYSAIKVDGARAYDLARDGEAPELKERPIWVESLKLLNTPSDDTAEFEMVCGKGGYVRAVARDLGENLGCYGHIIQLRRIWAGPFDIDEAIAFETLDEWREMEYGQERLSPVAAGLDDIPAFDVDSGRAAQLHQGRAIPLTGALMSETLSYGDTVWASYNGEPVAVGAVKSGLFHPTRVFNLTTPQASPPQALSLKDDDVDHC